MEQKVVLVQHLRMHLLSVPDVVTYVVGLPAAVAAAACNSSPPPPKAPREDAQNKSNSTGLTGGRVLPRM